MSSSSEAVKRWRNNTKLRMIEAMGGKCCICGYDRSPNALEFHHLNPAEKDFGFGAKRANPSSWAAIVVELKKCVMVCANCHREIHDGTVDIPADAPSFDSTYEDYRPDRRVDCPVCGTKMPVGNKTCSKTCSGKRALRVDWSKYNLEEMLLTMSLSDAARLIGVSSAAVVKRRKKLRK